MERPRIKIIQTEKGRTYVSVNGEYAGFVVDNGYMPLEYQGEYSAIVDGKRQPVESIEAGIKSLLVEFCTLEGA